MQSENNAIHLRGTVAQPLTQSHESHGELFYRMMLDVPRLSSTHDVLPVTVPERLLGGKIPSVGDTATIDGQIRTYNALDDAGRRHVILTVFATRYDASTEPSPECPNLCTLGGWICRKPVYRLTPNGREIADVLVGVDIAYGKKSHIPCITWGRSAFHMRLAEAGMKIKLSGRLQSRQYEKQTESGTVTCTTYEVSVFQYAVDEIKGGAAKTKE